MAILSGFAFFSYVSGLDLIRSRPSHWRRAFTWRIIYMKLVEQQFSEIEEKEFEDIDFERCEFIGTDARRAKFIDCTFTGCSLSSIKIDGAVFQVRFANTKIEGINFFTAKREVMSLSFERCLIRYCSFAELKL